MVPRQRCEDAELLRFAEGVAELMVERGGGDAPRRLRGVVGVEDVDFVELVTGDGGGG